MMKPVHLAMIAAVAILAGCSTRMPHATNRIIFSPSEGTSYLDASRSVIESQGWRLVSEHGSSTRTSEAAEEVTITGQTPEGKKVFFTVQGTAALKSTHLEVTTDDGFPLSPAEIVDLVKNQHRK